MKFILGQKKNMTQIWEEEEVKAVTVVKADPCTISSLKDLDKDGYRAIQLSQGEKKAKNLKKPQANIFKKLNISPRYTKEFRVKELPEQVELGKQIKVDTFEKGEKVKVTGFSKGRGFQGVVKRHGFAGAIKTHGTKDQLRMPGSIGAIEPAHVFKGTRMPGRMGNKQITLSNLEITDIDTENNLLYIKGAIPGSKNGLVMIKGEGELKISEAESNQEEVSQEKAKESESQEQTEDTNQETKDSSEEDSSQEQAQEKEEENKEEKTENTEQDTKQETKDDSEEKTEEAGTQEKTNNK